MTYRAVKPNSPRNILLLHHELVIQQRLGNDNFFNENVIPLALFIYIHLFAINSTETSTDIA